MDEEKKNQNQEPAQPPAPLSDARKAALLRYMAILFAVAFLLVLLSLILQTHSSKSTISELSAASTSALDNAVKLQEQNRTLQEEKQQLQDELDELQKKLDEETALNEQLLAASQDEEKDAKQELRDKEQIPLTYPGGIAAFMEREVLPYAPDAYVCEEETKVGYELSFTKYFYHPVALRPVTEIVSDIRQLEQDADGLLAEILNL